MTSKFNEIYSTKFGSLLLDTLVMLSVVANSSEEHNILNDDLSDRLSACGSIFTGITLEHYNLSQEEMKSIVTQHSQFLDRKLNDKLN